VPRFQTVTYLYVMMLKLFSSPPGDVGSHDSFVFTYVAVSMTKMTATIAQKASNRREDTGPALQSFVFTLKSLRDL
jgi:hypothetical protein